MDPILTVCLITYNHVNYIRQAIDGVLMQKVNFSWNLVIADDFSTDGTREILLEYKKKYPDFIHLILQGKNVGARQNWIDLLSYPCSKYIAYFEGDDYWTDTYKLQKQVDFLEKNPEYSLSFCRFQVLNEKTGELENDKNELLFTNETDRVEFDFERFYLGWHVGTQTLLFKRANLNLQRFSMYKFARDIHLFTELLLNGKGTCLNFFGAVYRVHDGGIYNGINEFKRAQMGYLCYKEIFKSNKNIYYLKCKFRNFAQNYILELKNNNQYLEAILLEVKILPYQSKRNILKLLKQIIYNFLKAIKIKNKKLSSEIIRNK